jgi:uroporphyrinogen-III synthase
MSPPYSSGETRRSHPRSAGAVGLRVVAFESRRGGEMAELIRRHGGDPLIAPTMREVVQTDRAALLAYVQALAAGEIDVVILLTGVGVRLLAETVAQEWPRERLAAALRRARLVARGPKPVAALRALGVQPDVLVPEPNTWREVLATLDQRLPVAGARVAVQEYGVSNEDLVRGLEARGASVRRVPIYRWELPDDLGPLRAAIEAVCGGRADVVLFTSANQVYTLFHVAGTEAGRLRAACNRVLIASVGPICSAAVRDHGLSPDLEPEHAKMGHLVAEVARRGRAVLARKRAHAGAGA